MLPISPFVYHSTVDVPALNYTTAKIIVWGDWDFFYKWHCSCNFPRPTLMALHILFLSTQCCLLEHFMPQGMASTLTCLKQLITQRKMLLLLTLISFMLFNYCCHQTHLISDHSSSFTHTRMVSIQQFANQPSRILFHLLQYIYNHILINIFCTTAYRKYYECCCTKCIHKFIRNISMVTLHVNECN